MIEKMPLLSFLADQVVAKEKMVLATETELDSLIVGSEQWLAVLLKLTAAKSLKAAYLIVAEYVSGLETL